MTFEELANVLILLRDGIKGNFDKLSSALEELGELLHECGSGGKGEPIPPKQYGMSLQKNGSDGESMCFWRKNFIPLQPKNRPYQRRRF